MKDNLKRSVYWFGEMKKCQNVFKIWVFCHKFNYLFFKENYYPFGYQRENIFGLSVEEFEFCVYICIFFLKNNNKKKWICRNTYSCVGLIQRKVAENSCFLEEMSLDQLITVSKINLLMILSEKCEHLKQLFGSF